MGRAGLGRGCAQALWTLPPRTFRSEKGAWTGKGLGAPEGCTGVNMSPQIHVHLEPLNETPPGNRVFADVVSYAEVGPNPINANQP